MSESDEDRRLRIELMETQIDHARIDMKRIEREMRLEIWKALAALLSATAAWAALILAVAHFIK